MSKPLVTIYTDGACTPQLDHSPGGWAALLMYDMADGETKRHMLQGNDKNTTNNRMELLAVISALEYLKKSCTVKLYTDSKYVINGITVWIAMWKKRDWINSAKKPVVNKDLWVRLDAITSKHDVEWIHVHGHSGDEFNEIVDAIAVKEKELALDEQNT